MTVPPNRTRRLTGISLARSWPRRLRPAAHPSHPRAGPDGDGGDTRDSLRRILHGCRELPGLDAVVVTGDIVDDGSPEAYRDARRLVGAFTAERRIPAIFSTGSHDERGPFAAYEIDARELDAVIAELGPSA